MLPKLKLEEGDEVFLSAPKKQEENTATKLSKSSISPNSEKSTWKKFIDPKTYLSLFMRTSRRLVKSFKNKPLKRDQSSAGVQTTLETVYYLVMKGNNRDYVRLNIPDTITLQELSSQIIQNEGFNSEWTCALYTSEGYPLTGNLSQMLYTKCKDVLEDGAHICLFIVPNFDYKTLEPIDPSEGQIELTLANHSDSSLKFAVCIDHDTTVQQLKQKVYAISGIPTFELRLRTEDLFLSQDDEFVSSYGNLPLIHYERVFMSYGDKTYKGISKQSIEQSSEGLKILHTFLYCFSKVSASCDYPTVAQFLSGVRKASNNCTPLVQALYELSQKQEMSLLNSIALEEGFILMIKRFLATIFYMNVPEDTFLEYTLDVCGVLAHVFSSNSEAHLEESFREMSIIDPLEYSVMRNPVLVPKEDGTETYYDIHSLFCMLRNNESIRGGLKISEDELVVDYYFELMIRRCELNGKTSVFAWTGYLSSSPSLAEYIIALHPGGLQWSKAVTLKTDFKITSIVPPLLLKNPNFRNCMTLDMLKQLCINRGLTHKKPNEVELMTVIAVEAVTVDVDELASLIELQSTQESEESEECLTRDPEEAIVVVFDKSDSMASNDFNNYEFSRIDATKQFFESFVDRTVGYNYFHAVSLILFSSSIEKTCGFTENLSTFAHYVRNCTISGLTRLFDTISVAVDELIEFHTKYPKCKLRILCLSDGEDNQSNTDPLHLADKLLSNNVTLDSVVVGEASYHLKAISFATGGYIFLPNSVQDGIKLFESETFLSLRNRDPPIKYHLEDYNILIYLPFSEGLPPMKKPSQLSSQIEHPRTAVQKSANTHPQFQNLKMGTRFKRIMRELNSLTDNPHPSIEVYPAVDDSNFWNVYIHGPEHTPYQGGIFHIYILFGDGYPQEAPEVRFITPIYHCNINSNGRVCHSILGELYSAGVSVRQILDCIYGLLMVPEPQDPLDANIAAEYLDNAGAYYEKVSNHTNQHAKKQLSRPGYASSTPSNFCDPVTGAVMDDPVICMKTNSTYERREIERIINETGRDPISGQIIGIQDLVPNIQLKKDIQYYRNSLNSPWFLN